MLTGTRRPNASDVLASKLWIPACYIFRMLYWFPRTGWFSGSWLAGRKLISAREHGKAWFVVILRKYNIKPDVFACSRAPGAPRHRTCWPRNHRFPHIIFPATYISPQLIFISGHAMNSGNRTGNNFHIIFHATYISRNIYIRVACSGNQNLREFAFVSLGKIMKLWRYWDFHDFVFFRT